MAWKLLVLKTPPFVVETKAVEFMAMTRVTAPVTVPPGMFSIPLDCVKLKGPKHCQGMQPELLAGRGMQDRPEAIIAPGQVSKHVCDTASMYCVGAHASTQVELEKAPTDPMLLIIP